MTIKITLRKANRQMYIAALTDNGGNRTKAARQLGVSRRTLQRNLPKMGLAMRPTSRNQASPRPKWAKDIREERQRKATPPMNTQQKEPTMTLINDAKRRTANLRMIVTALHAAGGSKAKMAMQLGLTMEELKTLMLENQIPWDDNDKPINGRPNWDELIRHQQEFKQREIRKVTKARYLMSRRAEQRKVEINELWAEEITKLWTEHCKTTNKVSVALRAALGRSLVE